jgi:hypothetical protein
MEKKYNTPILFLIFNRPNYTKRVFEEIRKIKPHLLFVVADGPRKGNMSDDQRCREARKVINQVDWKCEVITNFRDVNLGCKLSVSKGIDWFFENVEKGIILEDDTLPNRHFFYFCEELLDRFENDTRIMQISGTNFHFGWQRDNYSYYFSKYGIVWGWATWRRAWRMYDVNLSLYLKIKKEKYLLDIYANHEDEAKFRELVLERTLHNKLDTWDHQWWFAKLINSGLTVNPNKNLISNIGFGSDSTHTRSKDNIRANVPIETISFPLRHPPFIIRDLISDQRLFATIFKPMLNSKDQMRHAKYHRVIKFLRKLTNANYRLDK